MMERTPDLDLAVFAAFGLVALWILVRVARKVRR